MLPGTGNSVAQYRVIRLSCACCNGTGTIFSKSDLRSYVKGLCFSWRRKIVMLWRKDGYITCEECRGTGRVESKI